ncbi:MAG: insulinase family protein [Bacteroidales bacterium]|nr:insulinase family protein [Candidatus Sodaliphilus aphodohippi]
MKRFLYTLLFVLSCVTGFAQTATTVPSALIPVDKRIKIGKLDNGLTYYIRHNNWPENRACFYIVQRIGSLQEEENQRGLAHFLEHMCFNGSEHFEGNAVEHFCESLGVSNGGGVNAYTSIEETVYYIDNVPTTVGQERLDSCLLILYDWANGLTLDSLEIEKERGIIHEEWRRGHNALERIEDRQLPILYPGSKYGVRMPIGLMDVVDNFDHQRLRDFYEKWYNPENQCIVVVGDIDVDHVEAQIKNLFAGIVPPANKGTVVKEEVPDHKGIIYSIDRDRELARNYVQVLFKHKAYTPEEKKYVSYLEETYRTNAVISMLNTRYGDEALKENCPFDEADATFEDYMYSTTKASLDLCATAKDGRQLEALTAMIKECRRAAEFGFTRGEFDRYKANMICWLDNLLTNADKQNSSDLCGECFNNYLHGDNICAVEDYVPLVKGIIAHTTLDDINKRLRELLPQDDDNTSVICWSIEKDGNSYPTEQQLYAALQDGRNCKIEPFVDKLKDAKLYPREPKKGKIVKEESNSKIGYTKLSLSNGATVLLKHTDIDKGEVLFQAYGKGGWSLYPENDSPNINTFHNITFGNNNIPVTDIAKLLAGKNVGLSNNWDMENFYFNGNANPKDLETLMQMIYADFTCPSSDRNAFGKAIDNVRINLENRTKTPELVFDDSVYVITHSHHPQFALLDTADLAHVNLDQQLKIFKEQTSNAAGFTFVFVGNYDEKTIRPLIEKYIASLPADKKHIRKGHFINSWLHGDVNCSFEREMETSKTMLYMEWFSVDLPYTMENTILVDFARRILNMVYNKVIREEHSATYDCGVKSYLLRGGDKDCKVGYYSTCEMKPEMHDLVISLMKEEFDKMSVSIDETMFNNAKESMLATIDNMEKTSNSFWLELIMNNEKHNTDLLTNRKEFIRSLTTEDVMKFMKTFQSTSHRCQIVMTPAE